MSSNQERRQPAVHAKREPPKQADYDNVEEYLTAYDAWERGEIPKPTRRHWFIVALENGGDWAQRTHAEAVEVEGWGVGQPARAREDYERAQLQFRDALRGYVDRWLDSALHPDGSETPYSRRLLLGDFVRLQKGFLDGHATAVLDLFGKITFGLEGYGPGTKRNVELIDQASLDATVYFLRFLQSEDRFGLAKCRRCGKYLIKGKHERRFRKNYLRGIHCESCRNKVTAVLSRGRSLKQFEDEWLPLAVRAYHKGRSKYGDDNGLKRFILQEVNSRLDAMGPRLRLNRLTMWWKQIVRIAEGKVSAPATKSGTGESAERRICLNGSQRFKELKDRKE